MTRSLFAVLLALSCLAVPSAQTVRQGTTDAAAIPHVFHSPMVIETVFAATDRATWGKGGWFDAPEYIALGQYTCDGVALRRNFYGWHNAWKAGWDSGIAMRAREGKGGALDVAVRVSLVNPKHNHDKAITLFLEVLNDTRVVTSVAVGPVPVKDDGMSRDETVKLTVPIGALQADPPTTLRITMTTKDY